MENLTQSFAIAYSSGIRAQVLAKVVALREREPEIQGLTWNVGERMAFVGERKEHLKEAQVSVGTLTLVVAEVAGNVAP